MDFSQYEVEASRTAVYPQDQGVYYTALGLAGEAGEVANKVKKIMRDDEGLLSHERAEQIAQELGGVLWYLSECARQIGIPLTSIANGNLVELQSRRDRGVIQGSGDNR